MDIGILSQNSNLYSTKRLVEEGLRHNCHMEVINPLKCYANISHTNPEIFISGSKSSRKLNFDAVIPRIGASITKYGTAIVRQFEISGVYSVNDSVSIVRSRDKLRAHQILAKKKIDMPKTGYAHSARATNDLIKFVGGAPLIVKVLTSTQGKGVLLAETTKAAESLINAFLNLNTDFLVQEFIKESGGSDIRCFVIGDNVIASMERHNMKGDFRSNLHNGGVGRKIEITKEEEDLAVNATKILGLEVAGVDIIRSERGPLILEINSSPGIEGIENITNINVAGHIIRYIKDQISNKKSINK